jgi:hypothetical protein
MKTNNSVITLAWMTVLFVLAPTAANAQTFQEPEQAVQAYITAVSTGSGVHIQQAFADNAEIQYYNGDGEYQYYSRTEFAELVDTGNVWDAQINLTNLLRTGNAANATVEFTWGENGEHGYVDYLNLIYANGSWRITNKVAQYVAR